MKTKKKLDKKWLAIGTLMNGILLAAMMIYNTYYFEPDCPMCVNNTVEMYNRGYIEGINDVVTEAYQTGIVKIPFNDTHYMALVPWQSD